MERINIFDSLRGYCALWVAVVHLARHLVLHDDYWIPDSQIAVDIFFILSGYVITTLIWEKKQDYHTFLFQRFFRLAPVFAFFCILYILHASFIVGALEKLDTTQNPVYSVIPLYAHGAQYWYIHLPAHIAMVHGLLEPWIPAASLTILPPGWTMTIEWQFYLLAPFLVLMIQNNLIYRLCLFLTACILLKWLNPFNLLLFTDYIVNFLTGILTCFYIHKRTERMNRAPASTLVIFILLISLFAERYELSIWCLFLLFAYCPVGSYAKKIFYQIFDNRLSNRLGRISYSFYLSHMLVTFYVIHVVANVISPVQQPELFYFVAIPFIILITTVVSIITYEFIEKPCVHWSKKKTGMG